MAAAAASTHSRNASRRVTYPHAYTTATTSKVLQSTAGSSRRRFALGAPRRPGPRREAPGSRRDPRSEIPAPAATPSNIHPPCADSWARPGHRSAGPFRSGRRAWSRDEADTLCSVSCSCRCRRSLTDPGLSVLAGCATERGLRSSRPRADVSLLRRWVDREHPAPELSSLPGGHRRPGRRLYHQLYSIYVQGHGFASR